MREAILRVRFCLGQRAAIQRGHEGKSMTPTLVLAFTFFGVGICAVIGATLMQLSTMIQRAISILTRPRSEAGRIAPQAVALRFATTRRPTHGRHK
jgi:hypothetical protein